MDGEARRGKGECNEDRDDRSKQTVGLEEEEKKKFF
jgi:hypothetical protein